MKRRVVVVVASVDSVDNPDPCCEAGSAPVEKLCGVDR
jgi:hypothetical protein